MPYKSCIVAQVQQLEMTCIAAVLGSNSSCCYPNQTQTFKQKMISANVRLIRQLEQQHNWLKLNQAVFNH